MPEKEYDGRDLRVAEELGGVKAFLAQISENLNRHCAKEEMTTEAMWKKIDAHSEALSDHKGLIRWIIGVGVGLQAGWMIFTTWLKIKVGSGN